MNLVLCGPSGSGKSTLTEKLLFNGNLKNLLHALQENRGRWRETVLIISF